MVSPPNSHPRPCGKPEVLPPAMHTGFRPLTLARAPATSSSEFLASNSFLPKGLCKCLSSGLDCPSPSSSRPLPEDSFSQILASWASLGLAPALHLVMAKTTKVAQGLPA